MASDTLVIGYVDNFPRYREPFSSFIEVQAEDLQSAMVKAMEFVELEKGPSWFWFIDGRYQVDVDSFQEVRRESLGFKYKMFRLSRSFGTQKAFLKEPFKDIGGVYWLPSLSLFTGDIREPYGSWGFQVDDRRLASKRQPYDAFRLWFDEPAVPLRTPFPVTDLRSELPIFEAHRQAARASVSENFWVFDADFDSDFDYATMGQQSFPIELWPNERETVNLWYAQNPINGLCYGHGGPKLFHKKHFARDRAPESDMTMAVATSLKVHHQVMGVHRFNWSAFSTWRTACRETAKLSKSDAGQDVERLLAWTTKADPNAEYASFCIAGAKTGLVLAETSVNIGWVNNYAYLRRIFNKEFSNEE